MKLLRICFGNWLIPSLAFVPTLVLFFVLGFVRSSTAVSLGMTLLVAVWCWLVVSAIVQLVRRKWLRGIAMITGAGIATLITFIAYSIMSTAITMIDGDHWADDLQIPADIPLSKPQGTRSIGVQPYTALSRDRTAPDLELYHSVQPGMYEYDVWLGRTDEGFVYLKAFEITQEEDLSEAYLPEITKLAVYNPSDSIMRFQSKGYFTIYEGDWGEYYAARFEVWFKPYDGGPEVRLLQKNYKIEGWMH